MQAEDESGNLSTLATAPYPTDSIDLGNQDQNAVASVLVTGMDASGNKLVYGASVPLQYGALDGEVLPIFVQRVGQNARLPNPPTDARPSPLLGVLSDRFLFVAGGTDSSVASTTQVYDFAQFDLLASPPSLPIVPTSMPIVQTVGLLIDASGGTYYDFSQNTGLDVTPPDGYAFSDVAGGQTIYDATDGYVFVVGATRTTGDPTAAVLKIDTTDSSDASYVTGKLSWLTLSAPRLGASAAWMDVQGLVVAGGSATAPGVEVLGQSATNGATLAYPPDPSSGSGMTNLDNTQHVLVAGGVMPDGTDAGVREVDLGCAQNCQPVLWGSLPLPVNAAGAFTFDAAHAFLVGNEPPSHRAPGRTHTFTLDSAGATEVPTKVPHTNAAAIVSPMVSSILLYGGANEIESFTPGVL